MKQSTKDKARGTFHEVKGKAKEKVGRATNNPDLASRRSRRKDKWEGAKENRPSGENPRNVTRATALSRDAGHSLLSDVSCLVDAKIMAVLRGKSVMLARPEMVWQPGDRTLLIAPPLGRSELA